MTTSRRMMRLVLVVKQLSLRIAEQHEGSTHGRPRAALFTRCTSCYSSTWIRSSASRSYSNIKPTARQRAMILRSTATSARGGQFESTENSSLSAGHSDPSEVHMPVLDVLEQFHSRLKHVQRALHHKEFPSASSEPPALLTSSHKATLRELAVQLCEVHSSLPSIQLNAPTSRCPRKSVLEYLARNCSPSLPSVDTAVDHYRQVRDDLSTVDYQVDPTHPMSVGSDDPSVVNRHVHLSQATARLRLACAPPYEWIVRSLLEQDTRRGLQFLLALRSDLRQWLACFNHHSSVTASPPGTSTTSAAVATADPDDLLMERCLKQLDHYLLQTFATWYAPGMLEIRRITYDTTPASTIETIAKHEAVHPVQSLDDLRRRLGPSRRVFGLFHPLLPPSSSPLVVLHVSLQQDIPGTMDQVHQLLSSANRPRVATFYSISNLQPISLAGVGLGEYLIKEAVQQLQAELPSLESFVTLSPLPGFRRWLDGAVHASGKFAQSPRELLCNATVGDCNSGDTSKDLVSRLAQYLECDDESQALAALVDRLNAHGPQCWKRQPPVVLEALERLAARYVVLEKHRLRPLDPVARFHVSNGAEVYRLCVGADLTPKGWRTGWGCMVNYRYNLDELAHNQARYEEDYTVPHSDLVWTLL